MTERENDRGLGELRPVDHLPGHTAPGWIPWPPPRTQDKDILVSRFDDRRGFRAYRDGRLWRREATGEVVVTGTGAEYLWREAEDAENPFHKPTMEALDRAGEALGRIQSTWRTFPTPGAATSGVAAAADLLATKLERVDRMVSEALGLAQS